VRASCLLAVMAAAGWAIPADPSAAQPVRLADGDSFSLGGQRFRLYGIDAPELHQQCTDAGGRVWPCGLRARSELRRIIGTNPVQCRTVSTDRYGRSIAICHAGGRDVAEEMVRSGHAMIIERRGSDNPYEAAQAQARVDKRGLWVGTFESPRDWRRANPRRDDDESPVPPSPRDWLARKASEIWQALSEWVRAVFGN
ncbi:MAG: thermonuclease family protein, partial [Pseudorhodoplanes sp.]